MNKRATIYYCGNALIATALLIFSFIYYPMLSIYLFPSDAKATAIGNDTFAIDIPKIHASAPIVNNVDPWDEDAYKQALSRGVAHAFGSALPGKPGTIFLFAHSSDYPWNITRYNTVFLRLAELTVGDTITLRNDVTSHIYKVREKKVVLPTETQYLKELDKTQLILQTCTPIGTAYKRLLIFADPV